jgi:phosphoenolpyruvate phosphomutase
MMKRIISAGDAITAKLVQEAGFDGIWISGFEASARLGLADNGSITMTEMLNIAKPIVDAVDIPVFVDTDTGYGNFQRTVKEFERIGVYAVCVEDNLPQFKINSLWGGQIPLMETEDFQKKILVNRTRIKIIARTEAIIRGYGIEEAHRRVRDYIGAGAEIVLPHTREITEIYRPEKKTAEFAIVPTKIPQMTSKEFFDLGYDYVIWANQTERVKIKSTRDFLATVKRFDNMIGAEQILTATLDDMKGLMPNE